MWIAEMESERFSWRSYGETEDDAKRGILKMWNKKDGYQRVRTTLEHLENEYEIHTEECVPINNRYL